MQNEIHAVIDTNVLVSALYTSNPESATKKIVDFVLDGTIRPLYCEEILEEYREVLSRGKFPFKPDNVQSLINSIEHFGQNPGRTATEGEDFPDPKDVVFYEVALSKSCSFLVTGNTRHFPRKPIVVTPAEMLEIIRTMK